MGSVISIDRRAIEPEAKNLKFYLQAKLRIRHGHLYQPQSRLSECDGMLQSDYRTNEYGASLTCFYCTKCGTVEAWLDPTLHDTLIGNLKGE